MVASFNGCNGEFDRKEEVECDQPKQDGEQVRTKRPKRALYKLLALLFF